MYRSRYLLEKTLGKYFKVMVVDLTTEGFNFSTPSIEINYSSMYRSGGFFIDLFFWAFAICFYPDGDADDNMVTKNTHDDDCELCMKEEIGAVLSALTEDNVALRDVIG